MKVKTFLRNFVPANKPISIYSSYTKCVKTYTFRTQCIADFGDFDVNFIEPKIKSTHGATIAIFLKNAKEPQKEKI